MWTEGGNNTYTKISQVVEKIAIDMEVQKHNDRPYDDNLDKSSNVYEDAGVWDVSKVHQLKAMMMSM
jgi:hypothetical protein